MVEGESQRGRVEEKEKKRKRDLKAMIEGEACMDHGKAWNKMHRAAAVGAQQPTNLQALNLECHIQLSEQWLIIISSACYTFLHDIFGAS